jgi:hypothetical protein
MPEVKDLAMEESFHPQSCAKGPYADGAPQSGFNSGEND